MTSKSQTSSEKGCSSRTSINSSRSNMPSVVYLNEGISSKKTAFIIVTVVGCIAILWPRVFYPMMFGGSPPLASSPTSKIHYTENRQQHQQQQQYQQLGSPGGCCEVILNREEFYNISAKASSASAKAATSIENVYGPQLYRKSLNLYTGEISIRQERPAHLHPDVVYQAMRERGRAIPPTQTIPIVDRKISSSTQSPRIVEGRPGPVPGIRPPMGAGALHQPQPKGSSMSIIMPLYTIGIVVFFGYTIMKIVIKKPLPNAPYGPAPGDTNFRKDVFGYDNGKQSTNSLLGMKLTSRERDFQYANGNEELYNASVSATNIATNLSASLKQHQHQLQQQQQQQEEEITTVAAAPSSSLTITTKLASSTSASTSASALPSGTMCAITNLPGDDKMLMQSNEQLMEIEVLRKKLEDTERAMAKLIAEMNSDQYETKTSNNENITTTVTTTAVAAETTTIENEENSINDPLNKNSNENNLIVDNTNNQDLAATNKLNTERSVTILGMEIMASCEGGQKWSGRPPTPVLLPHHEHSKFNENDLPEPQSIYLEGALSHDSQILVADSEIKQETIYDGELDGSFDEPAVVLSSKMTLSLINLDNTLERDHKSDMESPLADDIEIIEHNEEN